MISHVSSTPKFYDFREKIPQHSWDIDLIVPYIVNFPNDDKEGWGRLQVSISSDFLSFKHFSQQS